MNEQLMILNSNNKEYTYNIYISKIFKNQNAIQCLFNGSRFDECHIDECDFSRSDFEGMDIFDTNIEKTLFKNADIKSVFWKGCKISNCIFDDAYISNNIFENCIFENCTFIGALFSYNTIQDTKFYNCRINQSAFTLSVFNTCGFLDMELGDCSFYKNILNRCNYSNTTINIDSLGQVLGINQETMAKFNYIFLGKKYGTITDFGINALSEIFRKKNWIFEQIIYNYNCQKISKYEFIVEIANYFKKILISEKLIKQDELDFVSIILDNWLKENQIPLFSLIYAYNILFKEINTKQNTDINTIRVKNLMNNMYIYISTMFEKYYDFVKYMNLNYEEYKFQIHYKNEEMINFSKTINELYNLLEIKNNQAKLIELQQGSFIEIIISGLIGVMGLQFFLYGVNGVLLQLIDCKSKIKVLTAKNPPVQIMALTKEGKQIQPEACTLILNKLDTDVFKVLSLNYAKKLSNIEFLPPDDDKNSTP